MAIWMQPFDANCNQWNGTLNDSRAFLVGCISVIWFTLSTTNCLLIDYLNLFKLVCLAYCERPVRTAAENQTLPGKVCELPCSSLKFKVWSWRRQVDHCILCSIHRVIRQITINSQILDAELGPFTPTPISRSQSLEASSVRSKLEGHKINFINVVY